MAQKFKIIRNPRQLDISYYVWSLVQEKGAADVYQQRNIYLSFKKFNNHKTSMKCRQHQRNANIWENENIICNNRAY